MHKIFGSEVATSGYDLSREAVDLFFVSFEEMLLDVFFEIAFAVFKEEIEVVGSLFNI